MKRVVLNFRATGYEITIVNHEGRDHWVVPVTMMVEGVHAGNHGPMLYTANELGSHVQAWNGIPVTINHPQNEDGIGISANAPSVLYVGRVFNARMDGNRLRAEVWADINKLKEQSPEAYEAIENQRPLDVSVGVFTDDEEVEGTFNNESYIAIVHNLRPDHLALLPGAEGACSWDDGCGIRANKSLTKQKGGKIGVSNLKRGFTDLMKQEGFDLVRNSLTDNETGFQEIMRSIQNKLDGFDTDLRINFLEEVFDDYFVYRVRNNESGETKLYRRDYTVNADGTVEFSDDPVQVRKEVNFVTLKRTKMRRTKYNSKKTKTTMPKTNEKPCEVIDGLIANELSRFTEEDREWLEQQELETLEKFIPIENEPKKEDGPKTQAKSQTDDKSDAKTDTDGPKENGLKVEEKEGVLHINDRSLVDIIKSTLKTTEDPNAFIDEFMPDGLKGQLKSGLKMYNDNREKLIKGIVDNSKFTEEKLKTWDDESLLSLYETVVHDKSDYSGVTAGTGVVVNEADEEEDAAMLGVFTNWGKKKEEESEKQAS